MTPDTLLDIAIRPALRILPGRMDSQAAEALLLAIALQESGLRHRRQMHGGPARGYWQFEQIGIDGVDMHPASQDYARGMCAMLSVPSAEAHSAIEWNDVLAAVYARLALWRLPQALPDGRMDWAQGWKQYLDVWRPGKPREEKWRDNYLEAWSWVVR